ncbi:sensor histidine kinase [Paraburkholderia pallida]|uniref:histidine kinase n=1 Tax=Paraburkholderia pallida TaxID=2547399 RepID=A0A4P7D4B6_9BURK|nr:sensor histidine kinase [Paraburkholderia pallida]
MQYNRICSVHGPGNTVSASSDEATDRHRVTPAASSPRASFFPFAMKPVSDSPADSRKDSPQEISSIQALQIRELHHRTRNSLHLIACTLQLQSRQSSNAEARHALDVAARRINSVARIHEHLYDNGQCDYQPARDYLSSLLQDLHHALLGPGSARMLCLAPGEAFVLDSDTLVSLGSIVAELVTNAVKYSRGNVNVTLAWQTGQLEVVVDDEGSGFPAGFDPARDAGFGLRLAHHLCTGSGGTLTIDTSAGHGSIKAVLVP